MKFTIHDLLNDTNYSLHRKKEDISNNDSPVSAVGDPDLDGII